MNKLRVVLIGFMIGGGLGAKIGAFSATLFENPSWPFVEVGAGIGVFIGCTISLIFILMRTRRKEYENGNRDQQVATSAAYK